LSIYCIVAGDIANPKNILEMELTKLKWITARDSQRVPAEIIVIQNRDI